MKEKGVFRSALGGFHKQDVLSYIDQITDEWNQEREAFNIQVANAQQATEQATEQQEKDAAAIAQLQQQLADTQAAAKALQEQQEALTAALQTVTAQRDEALAQQEALRTRLTEEQDKVHTSATEMMAAENRLQGRERELEQLQNTLRQQQTLLAQYEATLGQCDGMADHLGGLVRPYVEKADRQAADTLKRVDTTLSSLLEQLTALQGDVRQQQQTLQAEKDQNQTSLSEALSGWLDKTRQLAQEAAGRASHFFR